MNTQHIINAHGIKFYLEQSTDFADDGRMVAGRGWFAGLVQGDDHLGGVFFDARKQALDAIAEYRCAA